MKYCAKFCKGLNLNRFEEISIIYERQAQELVSFIQEHKEQRVILVIKFDEIKHFYQSQEWKLINAIHREYPDINLSVCLEDISSFHMVDEVEKEIAQKLEVPVFFGICATNFDQLQYLLSLNVSDVYLTEEICFDLKRAKKLCSNYGVTIRAFPNIAQSGVRETPALHKFFIRPEDIQEYGKYIDVLEFWGPIDRQEVLQRIYSKERWFGDLKEIILDLNIAFDSRRILPVFGEIRSTCKRKCMAGEDCTMCDKILSIAEKLEDKGIIIKRNSKH